MDIRRVKKIPSKKKSFKLFYPVAGVILIVAVLTGAYFLFPQNKVYKNEKYSFSFTYPKKWKEEDLAQSGLDKYLVARIRDEETNASFQVRIEELEKSSTFKIDDLIKELDEKMSKELENFKKISSKGIKVNNRNDIEYIYSYTYKTESGETRISKQKLVILATTDKVFYLVGQAKEDRFSKVEKQFNQIIKSFKIN